MAKGLSDLDLDYPLLITPSIQMTEVNQPIKIYEGIYSLKQENVNIDLLGSIVYRWFPSTGVVFSGVVQNESREVQIAIQGINTFELIIDGLNFGDCLITNFRLSDTTYIEGSTQSTSVKGDKSIAVEKVNFSIGNLREFHGMSVKHVDSKGGIQISKSQIKFENEEYTITINACHNYKELYKSLKSNGGYIILYGGDILKKKGSIHFDDIKEVFYCFSTFLHFLNGRRCSAMFGHGMFNNEIIWSDYTDYFLDQYKSVISWPSQTSIEGLNDAWSNFSTLWKNEDDKHFLTTVVHWYVEANQGSGFHEGAIIMAQTALELIYNWLLIENKKILIGKDSESITAANKFRLLLSQLNVSTQIPSSFKFLLNLDDVIDGPDAFVQIRNAIVHSQEEKRKKLSKMHHMTKYQALQLGLWYIELSLLYILKYNGEYFNRCAGAIFRSNGEEFVPWRKNSN